MKCGGKGGGENVEPKPAEGGGEKDFGKVLDEKLSVFGSNIAQKVDQVNAKVDDLETKIDKPAEPAIEYEDEAEKERFEAIEERVLKKAGERAEEVVETRTTEKTAQDETKAREAGWFNKAKEDFPEMASEESEIWKRSEQIYATLPDSSKLAEDVVYTCAVRAERALREEKRMAREGDKGRKANAKRNAGAGGTDDIDTDETNSELTPDQMRVCKQHRIDPKKYAERLKKYKK